MRCAYSVETRERCSVCPKSRTRWRDFGENRVGMCYLGHYFIVYMHRVLGPFVEWHGQRGGMVRSQAVDSLSEGRALAERWSVQIPGKIAQDKKYRRTSPRHKVNHPTLGKPCLRCGRSVGWKAHPDVPGYRLTYRHECVDGKARVDGLGQVWLGPPVALITPRRPRPLSRAPQ